MSKHFYSSYRNPKLLHRGTLELLEANAEYLIQYIYDDRNHVGILGHPEVRIGLTIKLLHNLRKQFDETLLRPVLADIERLLDDRHYLETTGDPELRKSCLEEEYSFIQKYMDIDENMTLNTEYRPPKPPQPPPSEKSTEATSTKSGKTSKNHLEDQGCVIM